MSKKTIGTWYTYTAAKPTWMTDRLMLLVAVGKAHADDDTEGKYITDDVILAKHGGMETGDSAYVQAYLPDCQRPTYIEDEISAANLTPSEPPTDLIEPDDQLKVGHAWIGMVEEDSESEPVYYALKEALKAWEK